MTAHRVDKGRKQASGRRRRKKAAPPPPSRFARTLRLRIFSESDLALLRQATLTILERVGVVVEDDETRSVLLNRPGCREIKAGRLVMMPELVEQALETAPSKVVLYDRNGQLAMDTSDAVPRFCPGVNCIKTLDHRTGEHRACILADIAATGRVCEALANLDVAASLGYPSDVPPEDEAIATVRTLVENTVKPVAFTGHDEIATRRIWHHLSEVAGGDDALADKPTGIDLVGPVSPLKLGGETCRRLRDAARWSVPIVCYPALFPGMSGPITLAGSIAQSSAETLAGLVVHQNERPGAPLMSGTAILPMDMRQADLAYGSPEYSQAGLGAAEFFDYLGLPSWVAAGCSDSHVVDQQAAAEGAANMTTAVLSGTSFVHNLGYLSAGRTGSLEMLVLADELAGMASRFASGISVDESSVAVDVVARAAEDNSFLSDEHTYGRYLSEMWFPTLLGRSDVDRWLESGSIALEDRLKTRLDDILGSAP